MFGQRFPLIAALVVASAVAVSAALASSSGGGRAASTGRGDVYTIGLFGDMPYGSAGLVEYPRVIADINRADVSFSIFDGDLAGGVGGACTDALYAASKARFDSFQSPVVWLPGDNDWTDCWGRYGPGTGGYDPLERLAHERTVFASTDRSLGRRTLRLDRESSEPRYSDYAENVRWRYGPVLYVGLNVQGSNDNLPHPGVAGESRPAAEIARMTREHTARERANVHWLEESFELARRASLKAVLVAWQADPDFNGERPLPRGEVDGFAGIVAELRRETIAFPGQVVLVHGDRHYFKIDKPLTYDDGQVVANFTRVETFGSANSHWVSATVDPADPNVFTFRPRIVAGNVDDRLSRAAASR